MSPAFPLLDDQLVTEAIKSVFPGAEVMPNSSGGVAFDAGPYVVWIEQGEGDGEYIVKLFVNTPKETPALHCTSELVTPPDDLEDTLKDVRDHFQEMILTLGRICGYNHSRP